MKKLLIIGIGAGNPEYITIQAINALNQADVFFILDKGISKENSSTCAGKSANATSRTATTASSRRAARSASAAVTTAWRSRT